MSPLLQEVLKQVEQLTPEEQWQVMNHLMTQLQSRAIVTSKPTYAWELLEGAVPDLLGGQDAQEWVNSLRDEWGEREQRLHESV